MATYRLRSSQETEQSEETPRFHGLASDLLYDNVLWFISVRWTVAAVFAVSGVLSGVLEARLQTVGIDPPASVLLVLAAALAVANVAFTFGSRRLNTSAALNRVKTQLWIQIVFDLMVVTVAVHFIGATETFLPFTYLFHVVLACIFLDRPESFLVTIVAVVLYSAVAGAEIYGLIADRSAMTGGGVPSVGDPALELVHVVSAVFVWIVVWYLVSTLSSRVRTRDRKLAIANERLMRADEEKNHQMLVTTHDLKAPFSGIESSIEVLKVKHWEAMPEEARSTINRIEQRSVSLRKRINAILLLGELRSHPRGEPRNEDTVNVRGLIERACADLADRAEERKVRIENRAPALGVLSHEKGLYMVFSNLISNAISYSQEQSPVEISGSPARGPSGERVMVHIADHGIGIREDALPHVFEEFYRSQEASRFNRNSTGLGLSIVKEVAGQLDLEITIESVEGEGTTVHVGIPRRPGRLTQTFSRGETYAQDHDY